ncbi:MAG: succinate dehydrogenase cytochrome b subunit [Bdellovibrionaceae bacterium]|nr:succinate dehydrogenase cytochrome b subunit [Pseudobdellovibrionaceae bacterium]
MGLAGIIWAGFVFAHMAGNLLMFISADAYNSYGHALTSGNIIYVAEAVLLAALALHVYLAINLTLQNRAARAGGGYAVSPKGEKKARFGSKTMGIQGTIILVFIILHLITFKYGERFETTVNGVVMRDLFKLMVQVFQQPGYVVWYLVCVVLLGIHLSHGVGSVFQSFGWMNGRYQPMLRKLSVVYAVVVALGFIAQPIYVYLFARQG